MDLLPNLLQFSDAEVRAAAVFALGAMIQAHSPAFPSPGLGGGGGAQRMGTAERLQAERQIAEHLIATGYDASPLVRSEVAVAFGRVACGHADMFQVQKMAFETFMTSLPESVLLCCRCLGCTPVILSYLLTPYVSCGQDAVLSSMRATRDAEAGNAAEGRRRPNALKAEQPSSSAAASQPQPRRSHDGQSAVPSAPAVAAGYAPSHQPRKSWRDNTSLYSNLLQRVSQS